MIMNLNNNMRIVISTILLVVVTFALSALAADTPRLTGAIYITGKVGLKWQAVDGVESYTIHRKANNLEFEKLATSDKPRYFDEKITPGTVYTYKISCVGSDGVEVFSNEKKTSIPGLKEGEFSPPVWSGLRVDRNKILLRWDPVPGAIAYNVLRSTTAGSGYEVVGNATSNRYADNEGLEHGGTYYYVLTALNEEFDETENSEERSIKFGMSADERAAIEAEANKVDLEDIKLTFLFEMTTAAGLEMNQPAELDVNSEGNIFITDALNYRVNCYDNSGKYLFSFGDETASDEKENPPTSTFSYPFSIYIDNKDQVYVSDVINHDIQVFDSKGGFIKRIKVKTKDGQEPFRPNGIHVLEDGRIVTSDAGNHRFLIIDQNGNIELEKGSRGAEPGQFVFPDGLTVTKDGIICVVDAINSRVQLFDMQGNFIRLFGESGQAAGTFGRPKIVTTADDGRLWVTDAMGNTVQVFTPEGEVKAAIVGFDDENLVLMSPRGVLVKDGRFYLVNRIHNRVMVFQIG